MAIDFICLPRAYSLIGGSHRAFAVDHPGLRECAEHVVTLFAIDLDRTERIKQVDRLVKVERSESTRVVTDCQRDPVSAAHSELVEHILSRL